MILLSRAIVACVVQTSLSCIGPVPLPAPPPSRIWNLTPDPDIQRANLQSQLIYTVWNGDVVGIRELLAAGADVNGTDRDGRSPLAEAVNSDKTDVANLLLTAGARPRDELLAAAILRGHTPPALVGRLIDAGAKVSWRDADGRTPLHLATLANNRPVAAVLLDRGADVNASTKSGQTPLHAARKTPADLARDHEQPAVSRVLAEAPAAAR